MGKSKRRTFNRNITKEFEVLKREEALKRVVRDIKIKSVDENTIKYLNFFGIMPEELTEEGINYEDARAIKKYIYIN